MRESFEGQQRRVRQRPDERRAVEAHREHVVSRLLQHGLSPRALRLLLPEWHPLIERVASQRPAALVAADAAR
ncbi:hypothetical protein [Egicoccus sp. AB-alg2]|uniref:hypothetical protein n=1 Tax=Egicoccus sp. AB-alg2 TaxID=3242693 RepID=UPI00359DB629